MRDGYNPALGYLVQVQILRTITCILLYLIRRDGGTTPLIGSTFEEALNQTVSTNERIHQDMFKPLRGED